MDAGNFSGDGNRHDVAAERRDDAAEQRDRAAERRDSDAERRDDAATRRDEVAEKSVPPVGSTVTAETTTRPATDRREAAGDRRRARADRVAGAFDRTQAERDRHSSLADRGASGRDREAAAIDELTGVYLRGAGLTELEREAARARRERHPLVVAFIDVDDLKAVNDTHGHAAGDRMLVSVATTLRASLRPYDLVLRYGGDEFLCVLTGLTLDEATQRFGAINAAIAAAAPGGSVTVGLAQLTEDDSARDVIARADAALYTDKSDKTHAKSSRRRGPQSVPAAPRPRTPRGMMVYQVSYTSAAKESAHVTIAGAREDPAAKITVCGQSVQSKGDLLDAGMQLWPAQREPWCAQCLHIAAVATGSRAR